MSSFQLAPQNSLPPPTAAFTLHDGTGAIGSLVGNRLGFTGFSSIAEAATAAWVAHAALERRAAKSRREPAPYLEPGAMQLVLVDGSEWIESEGRRLARLVRPAQATADEVESPWYGIEIVLPPNASDVITGSMAQVVYRALRRSGMQWPMRRLAMMDQPNHSNTDREDRQADDVDSASLDSFPASDPPKWSSLRLGPPIHSEPAPPAAEKKDSTSDRPRLDSERETDARLPGGM